MVPACMFLCRSQSLVFYVNCYEIKPMTRGLASGQCMVYDLYYMVYEEFCKTKGLIT